MASPERGLRPRDHAGRLDPLLPAAEDAQRQDRAAQRRGQPAADLDAEHPLPGPVDVAQVEQQRRLVEGEADSGPEGDRERLLEPGIVGEQRRGAGAEGDQDPRHEVVDVPAAEANVPERPPAAANSGRREPDQREGDRRTR